MKRTVEDVLRAYLSERRLRAAEIDAVVLRVKDDHTLGFQWEMPEDLYSPLAYEGLCEIARKKVLRWMDKHEPGHSARALFTGES